MDLKKSVINLTPDYAVRLFAAPYIAGKGIVAGIATAEKLYNNQTLFSTIDLLGEDLHNRKDVEKAVTIYHDLIKAIGTRQHISISLKPTALGIFENEQYCLAHMEKIIGAAHKNSIRVTIDMEDHTFTDVTLSLFKSLRASFDTVGTVLQSRLFRTAKDIQNLGKKSCRIRMCIGIYNEPASIALQHKPAMKEKLFEDVFLLLDNGHFPEIATHDEALIYRCLEHLDKKGFKNSDYEVQMLLGVPRIKIQKELRNLGVVCRLYVPFAQEWKDAMAYCKRRLAANPMMGPFVIKNMTQRLFGIQ